VSLVPTVDLKPQSTCIGKWGMFKLMMVLLVNHIRAVALCPSF